MSCSHLLDQGVMVRHTEPKRQLIHGVAVNSCGLTSPEETVSSPSFLRSYRRYYLGNYLGYSE